MMNKEEINERNERRERALEYLKRKSKIHSSKKAHVAIIFHGACLLIALLGITAFCIFGLK